VFLWCLNWRILLRRVLRRVSLGTIDTCIWRQRDQDSLAASTTQFISSITAIGLWLGDHRRSFDFQTLFDNIACVGMISVLSGQNFVVFKTINIKEYIIRQPGKYITVLKSLYLLVTCIPARKWCYKMIRPHFNRPIKTMTPETTKENHITYTRKHTCEEAGSQNQIPLQWMIV
jgi:hypothetical protein